MYRVVLISYLLLAILLIEGGCTNTMDGAGQDIERAGEKIQETF